MKLKDGFILQDVGGEHMAVASGPVGEVLNGLVRNNGTADFIFRALMQETTEEAVVDAMAERYDAPPGADRRRRCPSCRSVPGGRSAG